LGSVSAALSVLLKDEKTLAAQIEDLEKELATLWPKLERIRAAIPALQQKIGPGASALMKSATAYMERQRPINEFTVAEAVKACIRRSGRKMTAPEIANKLNELGFKSQSGDFTSLIGVTLRILKAKGGGRSRFGKALEPSGLGFAFLPSNPCGRPSDFG